MIKKLIILNDFIFFLSNFDFETISNKEYINYYETTFNEFKVPKSYKIKENNLILYKPYGIIKNYKNYNLNYYDFNCPKKMRFMYEKYIKSTLISKTVFF